MRELDLLKHIYSTTGNMSGNVLIGPGDDMGMLRTSSDHVLVAVDQIVENIHFNLATATLEQIARKAITRNLSDVAAMVAIPIGAVAAACLPRNFSEEKANQLFDAMHATANQYNCPLFGGDITIYDGPLIISVTIMALPSGSRPILRAGAQDDDLIYVTGQLGGSAQTLDNYTHHLDFEPRLTLAQLIADILGDELHCMIDISDGLAKDIPHLCRAANLTATIEENKLPLSKASHLSANQQSITSWQAAVGDGEDYELCFCASKQAAERLPDILDGVPITCIGQMHKTSDKQPVLCIKCKDGSVVAADNLGWEHSSDK